MADKKLGAVVDISLVLLDKDSVEVSSGFTSVTSTTSSSQVSCNDTLGSTVDESLSDEDLGTDDDGGGSEELSVGNSHDSNEGENNEKGLHFSVWGDLAFLL